MTTANMTNRRALYAVRDYMGAPPSPVAVIRTPARLLHHRRFAGAVLAIIDDAGVLRLLRPATADHPELARLNDTDRATLSAAVLALHRIEGGPRDAA
jgi:hypothetical protein